MHWQIIKCPKYQCTLTAGKKKEIPPIIILKNVKEASCEIESKLFLKVLPMYSSSCQKCPLLPGLDGVKMNVTRDRLPMCICQNCRLFFLPRWWKIDVIRDFLWTVDVSALPSVSSSRRWWKSNVTWDRHQRPQGNEADPIRQEKAGRNVCA